MFKKKTIIVTLIIVILANFLPLNVCLANNTQPDSTVNTVAATDTNDMFYSGMGEPIGFLERESWFGNLIKTLQGIFDYITGAITMVLRIPFVGFATWTEKLISGTLQAVSDGESPSPVTIEDIVFNRVPIFDVNVFRFDMAGGQSINSNSIVYLLRQNVAEWYVAIRNLVLVILLVILVYLGLRMAITSIAEEKAKYKQMLVDWFVSFVIVLFLHFFIILVLRLNDTLIITLGKLVNANNSSIASFYTQMREQAHSVSFNTGWLATFVYLALVITLAKYIWKYANRLLSMYILIIFTPVVAVSYALDKIKDNRSQALGKWMKEIAYTVLIQSVHALIYVVFMVRNNRKYTI